MQRVISGTVKPTERFSSRASDYARYRPSYPEAALDLLGDRCGLRAGTPVADVGSGTGILTAQLLRRGAEVFAVEPNAKMRQHSEATLGRQPGFHSITGTAEATTLAAGEVSLWVAGQAFHWFQVAAARAEALRITREDGFAALLWNERPLRAQGFFAGYEALLHRFATDYAAIAARRADERGMREFFGGEMETASFPNEQTFDFDGLKGRLMSSSYAPEPGHAAHEPMLAELRQLFARHQQDGVVTFPYVTLVHFGMLRR